MINKAKEIVKEAINNNEYKSNSKTDTAAQFSDEGAKSEWTWIAYEDTIQDNNDTLHFVHVVLKNGSESIQWLEVNNERNYPIHNKYTSCMFDNKSQLKKAINRDSNADTVSVY